MPCRLCHALGVLIDHYFMAHPDSLAVSLYPMMTVGESISFHNVYVRSFLGHAVPVEMFEISAKKAPQIPLC